MRALAVFLIMVMLFGLAPARAADAVKLEWPDNEHFQELLAYLAASIPPVFDEPARPTIAQRLKAVPFFTAGGRVYLDLTRVDEAAARALRESAQAAGSGLNLTADAFVPVAEGLYLDRRYFSANLTALHDYLSFKTDPAWVSVDVRSIISRGVRRVWFHVRTVTEATLEALDTGKPLRYARGAWFVAEHLDEEGRVVETHAAGKRPDWDWDYGLYDASGAGRIVSPGNSAIRAPTLCWACHHRATRIAPFREWPDASAPIDGFKPEVLVSLSQADSQIVRKLAFTKGDDQVLGHYGGLAALKLRAWARAGTLPEWAVPLWKRLVAHVPELAQ